MKTYFMHKGLFALMSLLIFLAFTWALIDTGASDKNNVYLSCPKSSLSACRNPLFESSDCGVKIPSGSPACTVEFIGPGYSVGVPPPFIFSYFWSIVLAVIGLILLVNHLLFNRGFFKQGGG